jgi:hypothetical protein
MKQIECTGGYHFFQSSTSRFVYASVGQKAAPGIVLVGISNNDMISASPGEEGQVC